MTKKATIEIDLPTARRLQEQYGLKLAGATLSQTMGPYWREIIWIRSQIGRRCYVSSTHTVAQIRKCILTLRPV
jgi:hypothetical protein